MGYYNFPHTRNYDSDLGFLIKKYKELNNDYNTLIDIYNVIKNDINDITLQQLQEWINDGTLDKIINQEIFSDLNDQLKKKTNITEYNQNKIMGHNRTYGMYEKGCMASFIANDMNQAPQISGIVPSAGASNYYSRDSVALYTFGAGVPPLIRQTNTIFTANSVQLPDLVDSLIIDKRHNIAIKDLDFSNTLVDVFVNGSFTYFGFIDKYDPATKTFTLRKNTGFYKYKSSSTTTYTPTNGSTIRIGDITAVWGSNIIACDKVGTDANNVKNLCGMELMVLHHNPNTTNGCRTLHLVAGGSQPNNWYILADGSQPTNNGLYLQNLVERGAIFRLDSSVTNKSTFWIIGVQDSSGHDIFHIDANGKQTRFAVNANGQSSDGSLPGEGTVFILTDDSPEPVITSNVVSDGRIVILCNHGTTRTHRVQNVLGFDWAPIAPGKTRIIMRVGSQWYPVLYTNLK